MCSINNICNPPCSSVVPEVWLSETLARLLCSIPGAEERSRGCKAEPLELGAAGLCGSRRSTPPSQALEMLISKAQPGQASGKLRKLLTFLSSSHHRPDWLVCGYFWPGHEQESRAAPAARRAPASFVGLGNWMSLGTNSNI